MLDGPAAGLLGNDREAKGREIIIKLRSKEVTPPVFPEGDPAKMSRDELTAALTAHQAANRQLCQEVRRQVNLIRQGDGSRSICSDGVNRYLQELGLPKLSRYDFELGDYDGENSLPKFASAYANVDTGHLNEEGLRAALTASRDATAKFKAAVRDRAKYLAVDPGYLKPDSVNAAFRAVGIEPFTEATKVYFSVSGEFTMPDGVEYDRDAVTKALKAMAPAIVRQVTGKDDAPEPANVYADTSTSKTYK